MENSPAQLTTVTTEHSIRSTGRSLQRQLTRRFVLVFALVALLGGLGLMLTYNEVAQRVQERRADAAVQNIAQRFAALHENWQDRAEEVKAQIDFMRIFAGESSRTNRLKLQAYFVAMQGPRAAFSSGLVLGKQGRPLFHFGTDGPLLMRHLDGRESIETWLLAHEHNTVFAVLSVPLWLGSEGMGRLVLLQAVDNGTLRELASAGMNLYLVMNGRVLSSSGGDQDMGKPLSTASYVTVRQDGRTFLQRSLPAFTSDAAGKDVPKLVMWLEQQQALSRWAVFTGGVLLLTVLSVVLWLVLGRWSQSLAQRIASLSQATALFTKEHTLSAQIIETIEAAGSKADEIGDVAQASLQLMQSVVSHNQEHFAYLQTLDILEEGVIELDEQGRFLHASPGWLRLSGMEAATAGRLIDHIHKDDAQSLELQMGLLASGEKYSLNGRLRLKRTDDKELWVEYRLVQGAGSASVRGVLRDITQSYQLEKHVTHMALHDALTGLPNRVLLEDRCSVALRSAERNGQSVALGFLDLDHFKHVNDQFGHKTGDELLVALSNAMRACLRAGDTLARWGGDEFVVLLTELSSKADAEDAIAKLIAVCQTPIRIGDAEFNATFSMGVAIYPQDAQNVDNLLSQADRAMFAAKEQGRNTARFYAEIAQKEEDRKALYIQNRLATAIREGKIQAWFQPIVDATTRRVVSCEALARWEDETYGWVSPATFVPMAENLGLIRELGKQIWLQAIENLHRWRESGLDMRMAVNVSRRQLFSPTFASDLLEDLDRLAIPVDVVDLEITESVAMEDAEHTEKRLAELTEAGFGIAIDDFGTGYSSLSQLHDMPATKIKIDISFVRRAHDEQGRHLIQAIVKIASAFGLQTVGEGVETADIADVLTAQGVTLLQGYYFGKPMTADSFEQYLADNFKPAPPPAPGQR